MTVKPGADISNLHPDIVAALKQLDLMWQAFFPEDKDGMTVTSGHEGVPGLPDSVHGPTSKHYIVNNKSGKGEAVDIRLNDVTSRKGTVFCGWVGLALPFVIPTVKYDVFAEKILTQSAHLHLEL